MKKFNHWKNGYCVKKNYKQAEVFAKLLEDRATTINFLGDHTNNAWFVKIVENDTLYKITYCDLYKRFSADPAFEPSLD